MDASHNGHQDVVEISFEDVIEALEFDETVPSAPEAAAVASAIGAHLTDQVRAAAAAESESDAVEQVNPWTLSGRLDRVGAPSRRRPREVQRGSEWQAAARSR